MKSKHQNYKKLRTAVVPDFKFEMSNLYNVFKQNRDSEPDELPWVEQNKTYLKMI